MNRVAGSRIDISWAACPRWATPASSDLIDAVEMLGGGWAIIFIDIQGSGSSGRSLAANLMHEMRQHLAHGVNPTTAVRATHQHLLAFRKGRVGASIHACAIDEIGRTLTVTGFGKLTTGIQGMNGWSVQSLDSPEAGYASEAEPDCACFALPESGSLVIANDGVAISADNFAMLLAGGSGDATEVLSAALTRDSGRARTDLAVASVARSSEQDTDRVLRGRISIPARHVRPES